MKKGTGWGKIISTSFKGSYIIYGIGGSSEQVEGNFGCVAQVGATNFGCVARGGVSDTLQWGDFSSVQYRGRGKNLFNFSSMFLKHIYSMFCWYFGYFNFLVEGAEI